MLFMLLGLPLMPGHLTLILDLRKVISSVLKGQIPELLPVLNKQSGGTQTTNDI